MIESLEEELDIQEQGTFGPASPAIDMAAGMVPALGRMFALEKGSRSVTGRCFAAVACLVFCGRQQSH